MEGKWKWKRSWRKSQEKETFAGANESEQTKNERKGMQRRWRRSVCIQDTCSTLRHTPTEGETHDGSKRQPTPTIPLSSFLDTTLSSSSNDHSGSTTSRFLVVASPERVMEHRRRLAAIVQCWVREKTSCNSTRPFCHFPTEVRIPANSIPSNTQFGARTPQDEYAAVAKSHALEASSSTSLPEMARKRAGKGGGGRKKRA
jgi:hypothetical protein